MLERLYSKSFKLVFSSTWTKNFQMYKLFQRGRGTRDQIANILWNMENSRKYLLLHWLKPLTVWITTNCGKFLKRWEYQTTLPASWETCIQVKKQQLELEMEQQIGSKLGKEYNKAMYCHPAYLTYMQSTSWETLDWKKQKLESRMPGEISTTSDIPLTPPLWQKVKRN